MANPRSPSRLTLGTAQLGKAYGIANRELAIGDCLLIEDEQDQP